MLYWHAKGLAVICQYVFLESAGSGRLFGDGYYAIVAKSEYAKIKDLVMERTQANAVLHNSWTRSLMPLDVGGIECYWGSRKQQLKTAEGATIFVRH